MKMNLIIGVALVVLVLGGATYYFSSKNEVDLLGYEISEQSRGESALPPGCPYESEGYEFTIAEKDTSYINSIRGYSLELPKGYYLPQVEVSGDQSDPHFYDCKEGLGFELQDGISSFEDLVEIQARETPIRTSAFPGATVSGGESVGAGTWSYWYTVVYHTEKRAFSFASNRPIGEYGFLALFKLL